MVAGLSWIPARKTRIAVDRAWAEAYIRSNYPGDVDELIARCGNDVYDGPDDWSDSGNTAKMFQGDTDDNPDPYVRGLRTPRPDDPDVPWDYQWDYKKWWEAFWYDKIQ